MATATVPVVDRFGWTTFNAKKPKPKPVSQIVNIVSGAVTTAHTTKMSQSLVSQVLRKQLTVFKSLYMRSVGLIFEIIPRTTAVNSGNFQ